ncbi:MAG TPA: GatB/YqeY domain-containing protein [Xanthobacteraceae bacterium]|nr:GatB/YqeY domain-containing protein [Xanthobacteraceae bacterium]
MLRDKLNDAIKESMKSGDKLKLSTLRMVSAAIKNADIEARTGKGPLDDDAILGIMQKLIKQRQDSVELYEKGGRAELAKQEKDEIEVIKAFLPAQMSDAEMKAAIADIIAKEGASGVKDMGKVMAALKAAYAGKMDFGKASGAVKGLLAG